MPCPFEAKLGFATKETRDEYMAMRKSSSNSNSSTDGTSTHPIPTDEALQSVEADLDRTQPLYFWQLYSVIGKDPIVAFVTTFYNQIFADEDTAEGIAFRNAFANVSTKEMHIKAQSAYWIDAFGGGRVYWGGHARLGFHHSSQHAEPVMTAQGSSRWMKHMQSAIASYDFVGNGYDDPRIIPCIVDFLKAKVRAYAQEYAWEMDESDYDIEDYTYPPKTNLLSWPRY